ncbi:hypothetical protein ERJ75_000494800 [Trypanosoma vivax]|nr:hypothetical protein ERJ75_000494800 [Trypanosoma vivax]
MWCQLSRDAQKDPGKKTEAMMAMLKCFRYAKKYTAHAWLRKHMLQKQREKQLSTGETKDQDAPVGDGEPTQEGPEDTEFVCHKCHRVLKSKTWLSRHKCEASSIIHSKNSNELEQSVTAACPICSKECRYRWLLRHMRTRHPGYAESLRPQPRAKPKRKDMTSKARARGEWSVSLESEQGMGTWTRRWRGNVPDWVAARKRKKGEIMYVKNAVVRTNSGTRWCGTRARITKTLRQ